MKKTALSAALLAIASALVLSSCDAMFNTNVFKSAGLGQYNIANTDMSSASSVSSAAASSPTNFYNQLASDPTKKNTAIAALTAPGASNDNLVLAATIQIKTTDAGAVVDNIASQLPTLAKASGSSFNPATAISAILPATITAQISSPTPPAAFDAMVAGFLGASSNITTVVNSGATLPAVPGGTNQDTAYIGLVSLAVSAIQPTTTSGAVIPNPTPSQVSAALWQAVQSSQAGTTTMTAPFAINTTVFDMTAPMPGAQPSTAYSLLNTAGIDPTKLAAK